MTVRKARTEDLEAVLAREEASVKDPWGRQPYEPCIDDGRYFFAVAEDENVIAGYVLASDVPPYEAEIMRIAVDPEARKRGTGRMLMDALTEHCITSLTSDIFLEVREGNAAARALYEKSGFRYTGKREKYYADGEDALMMRRNLFAEILKYADRRMKEKGVDPRSVTAHVFTDRPPEDI
jgi:ribosomal-protein-alanine N-acetyltransferase